MGIVVSALPPSLPPSTSCRRSGNGVRALTHLSGFLFYPVPSSLPPSLPPSPVAQLEGIIKQMKVEVRSQEPATKAALSIKVQSYEKALAGMKSDLGKAREREEKDALFGGGGAGVGGTGAMAQRQRLLETNERLANQNRTIENARKVMAETELVGR